MRQIFENLKLPKEAINWLMMLYDAVQVFDDFADGDKVERKDLNKLIWNTLISMPMNIFYMAHCNTLWPVIAINILKWQASDTVEKSGQRSAMSYAWRAGFFDVVLLVYSICFGQEKATEDAHLIMSLYDEKFDDYLEEGK